jgi:uncharacterized protein YecE (DUF72 family)
MYYSAYDDGALRALAFDIQTLNAAETWCVFDNTAFGAATTDALSLQAMLSSPGTPR